jgi:hypothetical protein
MEFWRRGASHVADLAAGCARRTYAAYRPEVQEVFKFCKRANPCVIYIAWITPVSCEKSYASATDTIGARSIGIDPGAIRQDQDLLQIYANFKAIDVELDRLVDCDAAVPEQKLMSLHQEWTQVLSRASTLPARTIEGRRAKAAMLLAAIGVALGPEHRDAAPHEILAASIARDLTS